MFRFGNEGDNEDLYKFIDKTSQCECTRGNTNTKTNTNN